MAEKDILWMKTSLVESVQQSTRFKPVALARERNGWQPSEQSLLKPETRGKRLWVVTSPPTGITPQDKLITNYQQSDADNEEESSAIGFP